jgi:beta-mannanase
MSDAELMAILMRDISTSSSTTTINPILLSKAIQYVKTYNGTQNSTIILTNGTVQNLTLLNQTTTATINPIILAEAIRIVKSENSSTTLNPEYLRQLLVISNKTVT